MHKPFIVSILTLATLAWASPADACGMYIRPQHRRPRLELPAQPDVSKALLVRARAFEKNGEVRSALRLYERIMRDDYATKVRRASAAIAAYRIHRKLGDQYKADDRLKLALQLNPRNRSVQLAFGAEMVRDKPREAELALRRALLAGVRGPQKADAHALLAEALARQGKLMSAAEHLSVAELAGASEVLLVKARFAFDSDGDHVVARGGIR